jgi:hypothetical protein
MFFVSELINLTNIPHKQGHSANPEHYYIAQTLTINHLEVDCINLDGHSKTHPAA